MIDYYCPKGNRIKYNMKNIKLFSHVIYFIPIEKARE